MKASKRILAIFMTAVLVLGMATPSLSAYGESMGGYDNGIVLEYSNGYDEQYGRRVHDGFEQAENLNSLELTDATIDIIPLNTVVYRWEWRRASDGNLMNKIPECIVLLFVH